MRLSEIFAKHVTYPLWDAKDRSDRLREYRRLRRSERWSLEDLQRLQLERLRTMLRHAYEHCEFYRQHWPAAPRIDSLQDLGAIPIVSKADVRASGSALLADNVQRESLIEARTGGSTGKALTLYFDEHCQEYRNAAAMRSDVWAGWRPGMWTAALWGSPPVARTFKQKVRNQLLDRLF